MLSISLLSAPGSYYRKTPSNNHPYLRLGSKSPMLPSSCWLRYIGWMDSDLFSKGTFQGFTSVDANVGFQK